MLSSCKGGRNINCGYALCIKDGLKKSGHNVNYYLPVDLEILDSYFTTRNATEMLAMLHNMDSILQLHSMNQISIKKVVDKENEIYIDEKFTEITTDSRILNLEIEPILLDPLKGDKHTHVLLNCLLPFQKRIVSEEFKCAIEALKTDKLEFLKRYQKLPYSEKRIVRSILLKNIPLQKEKDFTGESLNLKKEFPKAA